MSQWQIASLIGLLGWLVLAVSEFRTHRVDANILFRSILAWGAIVGVIAVIVINLEPISAFFAPIRAWIP
ncbi:MAG: hypothetical protein V4574_13215 [Pseudomonadota bacterium]